ncbi:hypothetical protein PC9H_006085 [Pleurotus ostreatus]|uniref:Uncharacterized protein n=1 Tax=Pleurotus ostreatus TaxID=5322 RepID=A0A8H7DR66_PLEOS|nr:uncharacterized protein PC9H_006085 [Pleurotus ostreatus]KAF7430380.1 hypothetical protein PC9H_006085 [Pleurotus ostreatus]KAJ8701525.1 hypothetical protein PTI98_000293 [Pleurotus ostreatus]
MSESDTVTVNRTQYPFQTARSTAADHPALLSALLASDAFDEISDADNFSAVETYMASHGRVNEAGQITAGFAFWLYPTGKNGPFHLAEDGTVKKHGTLITVERGATMRDAMERVRASVNQDEVTHEHIAASQ